MNRKRINILFFLGCLIIARQSTAWEVYEETYVQGLVSGMIKNGSIIKMLSGSIYEVTGFPIQVVAEVMPDALVLREGNQFKLSIDGFDEPLICKQLVGPIASASSIQNKLTNMAPEKKILDQNAPLDVLIPLNKQKLMGLEKLTLEEKERLRIHIINIYYQDKNETIGNSSVSPIAPKFKKSTPSNFESKIEDEFEGWDGETIVKLVNGQIYEQVEYYYEYHYAYMPDVIVYTSGGRIKMKVEGVKKAVAVRRLK